MSDEDLIQAAIDKLHEHGPRGSVYSSTSSEEKHAADIAKHEASMQLIAIGLKALCRVAAALERQGEAQGVMASRRFGIDGL